MGDRDHAHRRKYFVNEQWVGPYAIWHHQHFLEPTPEWTRMSDIVSYRPPFGVLGRIANRIIIQKKLEEIFAYRENVLNELFGDKAAIVGQQWDALRRF